MAREAHETSIRSLTMELTGNRVLVHRRERGSGPSSGHLCHSTFKSPGNVCETPEREGD